MKSHIAHTFIFDLVSRNVADSLPTEFVSNTFTGMVLRSSSKGKGIAKILIFYIILIICRIKFH